MFSIKRVISIRKNIKKCIFLKEILWCGMVLSGVLVKKIRYSGFSLNSSNVIIYKYNILLKNFYTIRLLAHKKEILYVKTKFINNKKIKLFPYKIVETETGMFKISLAEYRIYKYYNKKFLRYNTITYLNK